MGVVRTGMHAQTGQGTLMIGLHQMEQGGHLLSKMLRSWATAARCMTASLSLTGSCAPCLVWQCVPRPCFLAVFSGQAPEPPVPIQGPTQNDSC